MSYLTSRSTDIGHILRHIKSLYPTDNVSLHEIVTKRSGYLFNTCYLLRDSGDGVRLRNSSDDYSNDEETKVKVEQNPLPKSPSSDTRSHSLDTISDMVPRSLSLSMASDLIPRPHSLDSSSDLISRSLSLDSSSDLIPRSHTLNISPDSIPRSHTLNISPDSIPRSHTLNISPDSIPRSHAQASPSDLIPLSLESASDLMSRSTKASSDSLSQFTVLETPFTSMPGSDMEIPTHSRREMTTNSSREALPHSHLMRTISQPVMTSATNQQHAKNSLITKKRQRRTSVVESIQQVGTFFC